ncbi:sulfatase-like hydrolase/transferase [Pullulanibacillus pueri]|uniref:N-acetylgalactosamine-6-sulfatase n=1 Tax=Pullulanibacillus pueri TaxID=1437324 RepID=A0A8J2ZQS6_9BACL|nr:sulfatase-like hydrolase/transferase [Pullulanibacillus pueri]GGH73552.1 N-acetylgalactosamine-6-sulfatase [Pullulanibacillus pueri]
MGKPNVIIIYCDDLGYGDLGCFGSKTMKTPYLDQLAKEGVRFTNWYSNSPVCSPSRAALLTGKHPYKTGVSQILGGKRGTEGLPTSQITLAKRLKEEGYATGLFGKWHLGVTPENSPNAHGFDEFFGFLAGCVDYYSHIFYWQQANGVNPVHDLWHNEKEVWDNGSYLTEVITEKATQFIKEHAEDPFFLYVPYNAPHYPMHAPQHYLDRFPDLPPEQRIMAAMIAAVDDGVGEIVKTLRSIDKYEDSIIFFSSDNGPSTESRNYLDGTETPYFGGSAGQFRGHKGSLFDGGIREPAILSYPRVIPGGQVCDEVGMMMDIAPTLSAICGVDDHELQDMDGENILSMVTERAESPHQQAFWEYSGQLAVREGKWKLVKDGMLDFDRKVADSLHLSDMEADPGEQKNLVDQYPDLAARLERDLEAWSIEIGVL